MTAKYYIYRNLHKPGFFSIKHRGKVIARLDHFIVPEAEFRVNKAGFRAAALSGIRNVHAFAVVDHMPEVVTICKCDYDTHYSSEVNMGQLRYITYTPFDNSGSFVYKDTNEPISKASNLIFHKGKVFCSVV